MPGAGLVSDFSTFLQLFKNELVYYGSYWNHVEQGWKLRSHTNLKFVWFEEMKENIAKVIRELSEFLSTPLRY